MLQQLQKIRPPPPLLGTMANGNHQELDGGEGGAGHLYLAKSACRVATSARSLFKSYPWAA